MGIESQLLLLILFQRFFFFLRFGFEDKSNELDRILFVVNIIFKINFSSNMTSYVYVRTNLYYKINH